MRRRRRKPITKLATSTSIAERWKTLFADFIGPMPKLQHDTMELAFYTGCLEILELNTELLNDPKITPDQHVLTLMKAHEECWAFVIEKSKGFEHIRTFNADPPRN